MMKVDMDTGGKFELMESFRFVGFRFIMIGVLLHLTVVKSRVIAL